MTGNWNYEQINVAGVVHDQNRAALNSGRVRKNDGH
jgi:uncharacterized protein YutD